MVCGPPLRHPRANQAGQRPSVPQPRAGGLRRLRKQPIDKKGRGAQNEVRPLRKDRVPERAPRAGALQRGMVVKGNLYRERLPSKRVFFRPRPEPGSRLNRVGTPLRAGFFRPARRAPAASGAGLGQSLK